MLTDQTTGLPVPGATVTLRFADQTCLATTDATGAFVIADGNATAGGDVTFWSRNGARRTE